MFNDEISFEQVVAQLRRGEEEGANVVYHRFAARLYGLAKSRLGTTVRDKVDPEDVVQSAFRSFFGLAREDKDRFDVRNWDGLWAVLVVIAVRKCRKQWRHFHAEGRDVRREQPAEDSTAPGWVAVDREPLPEEAAALGDLVAELVRRLGPRDGAILELRLQGKTIEEIVAETGRSERSVYRVLKEDAKTHLRELLADASLP